MNTSEEAYKLKNHIDSILQEENTSIYKKAEEKYILENRQRIIDKIEYFKDMCAADSEVQHIQTIFGTISKNTTYNEKTLHYKLSDMFSSEWYRKDNPLIKDMKNKTSIEIEELLKNGMEPQEIIKLITCPQKEVT